MKKGSVLLSWEKPTYRNNSYWEVEKTESYLCQDSTTCSETSGRWIVQAQNLLYDSFGNLLQAEDSRGARTSTEYDPAWKTLPSVERSFVRQRNGRPTLQLVTRTEYLDRGLPFRQIHQNNSSTLFRYDGLGRLIWTQYPGGRIEEMEYRDFGNSNVQRVVHRVQGEPSAARPAGAPSGLNNLAAPSGRLPTTIQTEKFFDGSGVLWKTVTDGDQGPISIERTEEFVNNQHRVSFTDPFYASGPKNWTVVTSDDQGRPATIERITGARAQRKLLRRYAYAPLQVTTTNAKNQATTYRFNPQGFVEEITDAANRSLQYVYDSQWKVRNISLPNQESISYSYDSWGRPTTIVDPVTGIANATYANFGPMLSLNDAMGRRVQFVYDDLNRLTQKVRTERNGATSNVTFTYGDNQHNAQGRLVSVTDPSGIVRFTYDRQGNMTQRMTNLIGLNQNLIETYTYDRLNRMTSHRLPDQTLIEYAYSRVGHMREVKMNGAVKAQYNNYSATGHVGEQVLQGLTTSLTYDDNENLTLLRTVNPQNQAVQHLGYTYDDLFNILSITDPNKVRRRVDATQTFGYDALNRLTSATGTYGTLTYEYDQMGNIRRNSNYHLNYNLSTTPRMITGTPIVAPELAPGSAIRTSALHQQFPESTGVFLAVGGWPPPKKPIQLPQQPKPTVKLPTQTPSTTVPSVPKPGTLPAPSLQRQIDYEAEFDAVGNMFRRRVGSDHHYFTYDVDNQLTAVKRRGERVPFLEMAYNGAKQRVKKMYRPSQGGAITTYYIGDAYEIRKQGNATSITRHVRGNGGHIVASITNGNTLTGQATQQQLTANRTAAIQGSPTGGPPAGEIVTLNDHLGSSSIVFQKRGSQLVEVGRYLYEPFGKLHRPGSSGTEATTYQYTNHEKDAESGLLYAKARYLDPELSRFTTPDLVVPGAGMQIDGFNRYAYVMNNPMRHVDPTGMLGADAVRNRDIGKILDGSNPPQFYKAAMLTFAAMAAVPAATLGTEALGAYAVSSGSATLTKSLATASSGAAIGLEVAQDSAVGSFPTLPMGTVSEMIKHVAHDGTRPIVVVMTEYGPQAFYKSSGQNGLGLWSPFDGISTGKVMFKGWFRKERFGTAMREGPRFQYRLGIFSDISEMLEKKFRHLEQMIDDIPSATDEGVNALLKKYGINVDEAAMTIVDFGSAGQKASAVKKGPLVCPDACLINFDVRELRKMILDNGGKWDGD